MFWFQSFSEGGSAKQRSMCETFSFYSWHPSFPRHMLNKLIINASESMGECISLFFFYFFGGFMSIFIILTSLRRVFTCKNYSHMFLDLYISFRDQNIRIGGIQVQGRPFFLLILGIPLYILCLIFFLCEMGFLASSSATNASHHNRYGFKYHLSRLGANWRQWRWKRQTPQLFWIRHWWWWRFYLQHQ